MSGLPVVSGRECLAALSGKVLDRGTLRAIIRQSGLGIEEFIRLL